MSEQPQPSLSLPISWGDWQAHVGLGRLVPLLSSQGEQAGQESEHLLWSLQETGLKVNQPASFAVQLNGARGVIDARVHTPSGAVEECYVSELDSGELALPLPLLARQDLLGRRDVYPPMLCPTDKHTIRFIPHENGVHSIDVKFNGAHIPGSPFKIRVGEPGHGGDPGLVSAYGPGLEGGVTGKSVGAVSCVTTGGLWR